MVFLYSEQVNIHLFSGTPHKDLGEFDSSTLVHSKRYCPGYEHGIRLKLIAYTLGLPCSGPALQENNVVG